GRYEVLAPEHYGCETSGPWTGDRRARLHNRRRGGQGDRAHRQERGENSSHPPLVRRRYRAAWRWPGRIASVVLYEPSAFHLLRQMGEPGAEAYRDPWRGNAPGGGRVVTYTITRYPVHLIDVVRVAEGSRITIRPTLPQDAELQREFFHTLSSKSPLLPLHDP